MIAAGGRTAAAGALAFSAIAACGSLAPFTFTIVPWADAIARIEIPTVSRLSRFDLVANVALFVPIGFCAMAACVRGRSTRGAAARVAAWTVALSASLETLQLMIPARTPSLADFSAEQIGAALGAAIWMRRGGAIASLASSWMERRRRLLAWAPALAVYAIVWAIAKLFPFDATLDVHQLASRVRDGRIVLTPFVSGVRLPRLIVEGVAAAPVALLGPIGAAAVVTVAAGQALVDSRSFDLTVWIANAAGAVAGLLIAARRTPDGGTPAVEETAA
jgi:glycopeptide antibiotics resistance protein